jgi:putative hydrolase of the HAD superfamily
VTVNQGEHGRAPYSTYLFDVGGTLIGFDESRRAKAYSERARTLGIDVTDDSTFSVLDELNYELPARTKGVLLSLLPANEQRAFWVDYWAEGFRRIGVSEADALNFTKELLDEVHGGNFQRVYEDTVPALEQLRARGKRLGIVSNFSPNCESLLRGLGLADYFDFFIVSGIVRVEKPDPQIFRLAIEASGKDVSELVYVGDSIFHDVEGARGAGLAAILLDRGNRVPGFAGARIRDLREL